MKINGVGIPLVNKNGVLRFQENTIFRSLVDSRTIDLNKIAIEHSEGKISDTDVAVLDALIGYSVCGFLDLSNSFNLTYQIEPGDEVVWKTFDHDGDVGTFKDEYFPERLIEYLEDQPPLAPGESKVFKLRYDDEDDEGDF